tara:strand:+ start:210 stop:461 length:252 start_codon:yes stop_codon:yes gene_type:complete
MSLKFDRKFTSGNDEDLYMQLLDIIHEASKDDLHMRDLAELTIMSKTDKLIYRNMMACLGVEMTPMQVDEYLATIEYGLEYIA